MQLILSKCLVRRPGRWTHVAGRRLVLIWLVMVGLVGCHARTKLGPAGSSLAQALYTVCNLQQTAQLAEFRRLLQNESEAGHLTDQEVARFESIVERAEGGHWQAAASRVRSLLREQQQTP